LDFGFRILDLFMTLPFEQQPIASPSFRLGTAGWSYDFWRGKFYPKGLAQSRWLEYYVTQFNAVEVDSTFYAIPPPARLEKWAAIAPEGFEFALKIPQLITHEKSLVDVEPELGEFLRVAAALKDKLGPLLLQFPFSFGPDRLPDLLTFLDQLPRNEFRFVVELRHRGWHQSNILDEMRTRGIPLCWADQKGVTRFTDVTGPFLYVRWIGDHAREPGPDVPRLDRTAELTAWAEELAKPVRRTMQVYGFFNSHFSGHAPDDARQFAELLKSMLHGNRR
jgi:uncharacterized protein YecE (DUF72 family)